ncbi:hypothetical protein EVAR_55432_1 [Eumeta japonica]|uniref:Uncharacterized protein n=1 Tax=Eumeta variegata TaxID=151549 RepID=A0A4C1Z5E2_EUMVA|nr:hypothetical protein EVAR_55432_1 [Eumeta japonica]
MFELFSSYKMMNRQTNGRSFENIAVGQTHRVRVVNGGSSVVTSVALESDDIGCGPYHNARVLNSSHSMPMAPCLERHFKPSVADFVIALVTLEDNELPNRSGPARAA